MNPPSRCVILVPVGGTIDPGCEDGLRELERRGYPVWRVRGYAAVDAARNQLATDALAQGFDELMWIDADVAFDAGDVDKLRRHDLPLVCGIYPKKSRRQLACAFLPQTREVVFGVNGGLLEILYCGFGFVLTRRAVYETMQRQLNLPVCNLRFQENMVPYFAPMVAGQGEQAWYLGEDYAFCERARQCDFHVLADTSIRLWHVGSHRFGWEDAGRDAQRFRDYTFHISDAAVPSLSPRRPSQGRIISDTGAIVLSAMSTSEPRQMFDQAEKAFAAGRHDEAVSLYHQLLTSQFLPGLQCHRLAMIANREKDFDVAWSLHHQALELDPRLAAHITPSGSPHHHIVCRSHYETEDVGGGALASIAVDCGYRVCGLDLHPGYAERLRRLGVEFLLGDICSYDFAGRQFNLIVMGDVIEHIAEPRRAMAQVAALLSPNGLLWLSTPDYEGAWTRMLGDDDPMWREGEHLQYFCQRSLRQLLTEHGLAVIDYRLSQRFKGCMEVLCARTLLGE